MKKIVSSLIFLLALASIFAQSASVSPTRLYYKNKLGDVTIKKVLVLNKSDNEQSYQVSFIDFEAPTKDGKIKIENVEKNEHSISEWMTASPNFFALKSGESIEIDVSLNTPNVPEAGNVKWGLMSVKLAREQLDPLDQGKDDEIGMGIINTFQFLIYLFQTPPNITKLAADIYKFEQTGFGPTNATPKIMFGSENKCEAILDCKCYIEYTNLSTGETVRSKDKTFTLLPTGAKENYFELPVTLQAGKYSVMGVLDYGSKKDLQAVEIEIEIK